MSTDRSPSDSVVDGSSENLEVTVVQRTDLEHNQNSSSLESIVDSLVVECIETSEVQTDDLYGAHPIATNERGDEGSLNAANDINIERIAVQNSKEVTFGNKTYYEGPVTIKQYLKQQNNQGLKKSEFGFDDGKINKYSGESPSTVSDENKFRFVEQ